METSTDEIELELSLDEGEKDNDDYIEIHGAPLKDDGNTAVAKVLYSEKKNITAHSTLGNHFNLDRNLSISAETDLLMHSSCHLSNGSCFGIPSPISLLHMSQALRIARNNGPSIEPPPQAESSTQVTLNLLSIIISNVAKVNNFSRLTATSLV